MELNFNNGNRNFLDLFGGVQFQMEIREIMCRHPRSVEFIELGHSFHPLDPVVAKNARNRLRPPLTFSLVTFSLP